MILSRMFSGLSVTTAVVPLAFFIARWYPPIRPLGGRATTQSRLSGRFSKCTRAFAASLRKECIVRNLFWSRSMLVSKKLSISLSRSKNLTPKSSATFLPIVVVPTQLTPVKNTRICIPCPWYSSKLLYIFCITPRREKILWYLCGNRLSGLWSLAGALTSHIVLYSLLFYA